MSAKRTGAVPELNPLDCLSLRLDLIDKRARTARKGNLGTFRLEDLATTMDFLQRRAEVQRRVLNGIVQKYGPSTLIAEARLTLDELRNVTEAAIEVSSFAGGMRALGLKW